MEAWPSISFQAKHNWGGNKIWSSCHYEIKENTYKPPMRSLKEDSTKRNYLPFKTSLNGGQSLLPILSLYCRGRTIIIATQTFTEWSFIQDRLHAQFNPKLSPWQQNPNILHVVGQNEHKENNHNIRELKLKDYFQFSLEGDAQRSTISQSNHKQRASWQKSKPNTK